ncbi:DNA-directed RNA polymerase subunit omega [Candidatus Persebacteraceae bacterium Df01]|jgi:DNA-directed RNA polymerase omega subunit|uniref:DNA-directed RNA polymerase subunit omega n=1 Tax=Candidatus Doriopsillibacter californiensis TaxID=2970740 RepID=A0ABT7QJ51_9GAMM|nr:DNA-directed RNA polymerase subunit omega [Candidatus Persebacteraceae bacterium Df01]
MSRTTIADCLEKCPNHFNLAYHAASRANNILRRGDAQVPDNDDKAIVIALREIAKGLYPISPLLIEAESDT